VRALIPWPGAFTHLPLPQSDLLKIWSVQPADVSTQPGEIVTADKTGILVGCGQQALRILSLQREGGRRLTPDQFLAGRPLRPGQILGQNS
jgi:methionyl-tRNA formyltransferase